LDDEWEVVGAETPKEMTVNEELSAVRLRMA
jgi:hypothetical protein